MTPAPTPQQTWALPGGGLAERHVQVRNELTRHGAYGVEHSSANHRSWIGKLWDRVTRSAPAPTPPPHVSRSRRRERAAFRAFQQQAAAQRRQAQRQAHSKPGHRYAVQQASLDSQRQQLKMLRHQAAQLRAAARLKAQRERQRARERERRARIQRFNAVTDHALSQSGQSAIPFQPPGMLRHEEHESGSPSVTYSDRPPT